MPVDVTKNPGLSAKLAAERKTAKEDLALKTRVACAWTLANTSLPGAPEKQRFKLAENLLKNSTPVLKEMVRQAANNTFNTRLAESFKEVHKVELNEFLDDPSLLTKEKNAVESELKGKAKDASTKTACDEGCKGDCDHKKEAAAKKADDTKDAGPQPAEYPDPKRTEPTELDGNNAAKRDEDTINKSAKGKKADVDGVPPVEEHVEESVEIPAGEGELPVEGELPPAVEGEETPAAETEFDEQEVVLTDAIEDTKDAIENLQEALDEKEGEEDVILPEGEGEGDFVEGDFEDEEFVDDEFDVTKAFDAGTIEEKTSSLANEDSIEAAWDGDHEGGLIEEETGEDFFGPSNPAELEGMLDQEEGLSSPVDMFLGENVEDPMAALFHNASQKRAAADNDVVKPGELEDFFESEIAGGDDRDAETDHDGDILYDVVSKMKPVEQGSVRTKQDSEPELEAPKNAGRKRASLKLNPRDPRKIATSRDIVSALFGED